LTGTPRKLRWPRRRAASRYSEAGLVGLELPGPLRDLLLELSRVGPERLLLYLPTVELTDEREQDEIERQPSRERDRPDDDQPPPEGRKEPNGPLVHLHDAEDLSALLREDGNVDLGQRAEPLLLVLVL
jgi:hypothetical protein